QNPPEEIGRLLAALRDGVDVVGGRRVSRHDPWLRRLASWAVNRVTSAVVGVRMRDYGCMLRAYRRSVVDQILACQGVSHFIPALGLIGEYVGRIYQEVRRRPRYVIREVLE